MKEITAKELQEQLGVNEKIILIDVREPYEHEEYNIGGELIPLADVMANVDQFREMADKEIVLYCRSGNRSAMAQKMLAMHGINNTTNLVGGVIAWREISE